MKRPCEGLSLARSHTMIWALIFDRGKSLTPRATRSPSEAIEQLLRFGQRFLEPTRPIGEDAEGSGNWFGGGHVDTGAAQEGERVG